MGTIGARPSRYGRGRVAYGEAVWSWHPLLVSSRRRCFRAQPGDDETIQIRRRRWQDEFVAGESAGVNRSNHCAGKAGLSSAEPVVAHTPCTFFARGTAGAASARVFPAPSCFRGKHQNGHHPGRDWRRGKAKSCVTTRMRYPRSYDGCVRPPALSTRHVPPYMRTVPETLERIAGLSEQFSLFADSSRVSAARTDLL